MCIFTLYVSNDVRHIRCKKVVVQYKNSATKYIILLIIYLKKLKINLNNQ